jgi:wyosine [tRNA(Phe)-imidazoG37] synthetase (radical SAM superfamily)
MVANEQTLIVANKPRKLPKETAFGCSRDFLNNRFVYAVVSPRAHGLSIGINMNPDKLCNFDCIYCEVDRCVPSPETKLDTKVMTEELQRTLEFVHSGQIRHAPRYQALPEELLALRNVALSGDGEPTLCPNFAEAVESVVHVRAQRVFPFFKIVLVTNATGLDSAPVQQSFKLFTRHDEIWVKLDAGTQGYMERVNRPTVPLEKVLENILLVGRQRPVVIQSLFPLVDGHQPLADEIEQYIRRLKELKDGGAMISLVQIYSAARPMARGQGHCGHLPLQNLSAIARTIRSLTGLRAEVF